MKTILNYLIILALDSNLKEFPIKESTFLVCKIMIQMKLKNESNSKSLKLKEESESKTFEFKE